MLLLMCYNYNQYNIILIISFVISIHQLVAKLIVHYICISNIIPCCMNITIPEVCLFTHCQVYGEWCSSEERRVGSVSVEGVVTGVDSALGHGLRIPSDGYWPLLTALLDQDTRSHLLLYQCPRVRGKQVSEDWRGLIRYTQSSQGLWMIIGVG